MPAVSSLLAFLYANEVSAIDSFAPPHRRKAHLYTCAVPPPNLFNPHTSPDTQTHLHTHIDNNRSSQASSSARASPASTNSYRTWPSTTPTPAGCWTGWSPRFVDGRERSL